MLFKKIAIAAAVATTLAFGIWSFCCCFWSYCCCFWSYCCCFWSYCCCFWSFCCYC